MKKKVLSLVMSLVLGATMLTGCGGGSKSAESNGELNVFVWTEYVSDAAFQAFEKETGIKVNVSTFSSNEDMLSKFKSEAEGTYDVLLPSDYAVEYLIAQDKLMELDKEKLPNIKNINSTYLDPSYDPGNKYSMPYEGGVACIAVNKSKVEKEITSYADLFDPSLAGKVVVLDDYRAIIGITARSLGYSMNETDDAKLAEIQEKLLTIKDNVKLYDSDSPKSALISGDCTVGMVWSAEVALSMDENPDIDIVYPEEGAYVFLDNWVIPKGSKNYGNAMKFIDFMMSAETAKMNIEDFPYLCPNDAALELMGEEYVNNTAKNVPSEVIAAGEFVKYLDSETLVKYDEMWTKLKQ